MQRIAYSWLRKWWAYVLLSFLSVFPLLVYAQDTGTTPGGDTGSTPGGSSGRLTNPLSVGTLEEFLLKVLDVIVQIGWPLVVLAVIWTGFLFVKAQGKPAELDTAKQAFIWTIVGALIVLGAFAIATFVEGTVAELK